MEYMTPNKLLKLWQQEEITTEMAIAYLIQNHVYNIPLSRIALLRNGFLLLMQGLFPTVHLRSTYLSPNFFGVRCSRFW